MLTNANQVSDMLTNRMSRLTELDEMREEAIEAKAQYLEKLLIDGENVMGHTLESIAEKVLEDDLASVSLVTLFLHGRASYLTNKMQDEITRIALEVAPKLVEAELRQEY